MSKIVDVLKSIKSLESCIFTWRIINFSMALTERNSMNSSTFEMISATWHLELHVIRREDTFVLLPRLRRSLNDKGPNEVHARFSFTLELFNGTHLWSAQSPLSSFKKGNSHGSTFETKLSTLQVDMFENVGHNDTLIITCDMTGAVIEFANSPKRKRFCPDFEMLPNLNKLLENGSLINYLGLEECNNIWMDIEDHCARKYEKTNLENFLKPQKFCDDTWIESGTSCTRWEFPNFSALCKTKNLIDRPSIKGLLGENSEVKLFLSFNSQYGTVTCYIDASYLTYIECISCETSIIDSFGYKHFTKRVVKNTDRFGMCRFTFSFNIEALCSRVNVKHPHNTLIIDCDFKFKWIQII